MLFIFEVMGLVPPLQHVFGWFGARIVLHLALPAWYFGLFFCPCVCVCVYVCVCVCVCVSSASVSIVPAAGSGDLSGTVQYIH